MSNDTRDLGWHAISGSPRQIGQALGHAGRAAVHRHLLKSEIWAKVTTPEHLGHLARMEENTRTRFPQVWEELIGLAEGLELPLVQVFAWNCRGDILSSVPDGCTTVQLPGAEPVIAHNEDGLPFFRGSCFIAEISPRNGSRFRAFCYPGSIPGHTFATSETGLAQAVNNLRLTGLRPTIPRIVLGRAVLAAQDRRAALEVLRHTPNSGGFHFTLGQVGEPDILSVEFGGGNCEVRKIDHPAIHANHALHLAAARTGGQIITASSRDRQARGEILLAEGCRDPLVILRDTGGPGLPIRRDAPDDPDDENTLATAVMRVTKQGIEWEIHDKIDETPIYAAI